MYWGDILSDIGQTLDRYTISNFSFLGFYPVGERYPPNGFGLYNMIGNQREWCYDWYAADYYSASPEDDPTGPLTGSERVLRGALSLEGPLPCAYRRHVDPDRTEPTPDGPTATAGFRPVRSFTGINN